MEKPPQRWGGKGTLCGLTDSHTKSAAVMGAGGGRDWNRSRVTEVPAPTSTGHPEQRSEAWRSGGKEKLLTVLTHREGGKPKKIYYKWLKRGSSVTLPDQSEHPMFSYISTCRQKGFQEEILEKMPFITSSLKKKKKYEMRCLPRKLCKCYWEKLMTQNRGDK